MPYVRPTLEQINTRVQADIKAKLGSQVTSLRRSWLSIFGRVVSGATHLLYGYIQWASRQLFAVSADDDSMIKKAALYGLIRKPPSFASGVGRFRGNAGVTVPAGTILVRSDNSRFQTTVATDITNAASTDTYIPIRAVVAGELGNTPINETLELESPLGGVDDEVLVTTALTGGQDIETLENLKDRYLARVQKPPQGGALHDYEQWASELPFVGLVKAYGPGDISRYLLQPEFIPPVGEVWVYFSTLSGGTPSESERQQVEAYIEARRPVTAVVKVRGTVNVAIQIKVAIKPSAASTYSLAVQDVKNALKDLMTEAALPTATIFLSQIDAAISKPASERDHLLTIPSGDILIGVDQIGKLDEAYFDANVTQLT